MKFHEIPLRGAYIIEIEPMGDQRGKFARTFCKETFKRIGHEKEFVQFNWSLSNYKRTLRGMHYQILPAAETKLIRCIQGSVYDVIIDLRKGSDTFLTSYGIELSGENLKMMYVPEGFAHGFITLEDNSQLIYHHTNYYTPGCERAIRFDDPLVGIEWPAPPEIISEKDTGHPYLTKNFQGIKV